MSSVINIGYYEQKMLGEPNHYWLNKNDRKLPKKTENMNSKNMYVMDMYSVC